MEKTIAHSNSFSENYRKTVIALRFIRTLSLRISIFWFFIDTLLSLNKAVPFVNVRNDTFLYEVMYGSFYDITAQMSFGVLIFFITSLCLSHIIFLMLNDIPFYRPEKDAKHFSIPWLVSAWSFSIVFLILALLAVNYLCYYFGN